VAIKQRLIYRNAELLSWSLKELSAKALLETALQSASPLLPSSFLGRLQAICWPLLQKHPEKWENPFDLLPGTLRDFLLEEINRHWRGPGLAQLKILDCVKLLVHQDLVVFDLKLCNCLNLLGIF